MYNNPILQQQSSQRNISNNPTQSLNLEPIKSLMRSMRMSSNPQWLLQQYLLQNPQLRSLINVRDMNSLQSVAETMATQRGIDLNNLIQQLQN